MFRLAIGSLVRRPLRNALTLAGLAGAVAVLACLSALSSGYQRSLSSELDRMGMQLMLVPLGCPYDAAARVLKGNTLEASLPESALDIARRDVAVEIAAPLLIAAAPHSTESRADVWVGLDESGRRLKPWWKTKAGTTWFSDPNSTILGSEAADVEMRAPGDYLFSPETGQRLRVAGVLERSGTSDDSLFFAPLETAQKMFEQTGRLTAIAIRLRDPGMIREATERLQQIPGAQVVTMTEMLGTFLNLVGAVRALSRSVAIVALTVSVLGVLNTLLAAVVERASELSILRAIGASRWQVFELLIIESLLLTGCGSAAGILIATGAGQIIEKGMRHFVPFAPRASMLHFSGVIVLEVLAVGVLTGLMASVYPAWRASRCPPAAALNVA